jgi:hypothetical protein
MREFGEFMNDEGKSTACEYVAAAASVAEIYNSG